MGVEAGARLGQRQDRGRWRRMHLGAHRLGLAGLVPQHHPRQAVLGGGIRRQERRQQVVAAEIGKAAQRGTGRTGDVGIGTELPTGRISAAQVLAGRGRTEVVSRDARAALVDSRAGNGDRERGTGRRIVEWQHRRRSEVHC
ncbi:MAG: hypothetical protein ACRD0G_16190 [Acidimicrobiales bacterium]